MACRSLSLHAASTKWQSHLAFAFWYKKGRESLERAACLKHKLVFIVSSVFVCSTLIISR
jgi:hypothetical protein